MAPEHGSPALPSPARVGLGNGGRLQPLIGRPDQVRRAGLIELDSEAAHQLAHTIGGGAPVSAHHQYLTFTTCNP